RDLDHIVCLILIARQMKGVPERACPEDFDEFLECLPVAVPGRFHQILWIRHGVVLLCAVRGRIGSVRYLEYLQIALTRRPSYVDDLVIRRRILIGGRGAMDHSDRPGKLGAYNARCASRLMLWLASERASTGVQSGMSSIE